MIYEDVKIDKKKEKKNIKDFIPAVLVSLAASFMLMVFAPIEIYYSNQDQFWFEIKQLIPVQPMGVRFLLGTLCSKEGPTKWEDALLLCAAIAEGNFHAAHPVEVGANKSRAREDALLLCAAIAAYLC